MDYLVRSVGAPAATDAADDPVLDERHWTYMDRFPMIARGPTLDADRSSWTGSIHIVQLAGPQAARQFVSDEPYQQAGAYDHHLIWRFDNVLGRTMQEFSSQGEEPLFFVLAWTDRPDQPVNPPIPVNDLAAEMQQRLIVYGSLRDLDSAAPVGVALAVQAPDRAAVQDLLASSLTEAESFPHRKILDWRLGGRR